MSTTAKKKITSDEADAPVSVVGIVKLYIKNGDATKYDIVCRTLEQLSNWDATAIQIFIEQFDDIAEHIDRSCSRLVTALTTINWSLLANDATLLTLIANILVDIAIRHVVFSEIVLCSLVGRLVPEWSRVLAEDGSPRYRLVLAENQQYLIYEHVHRALYNIIESLPMSRTILVYRFKKCFPHHSFDLQIYRQYLRNVIAAAEYMYEIRPQLWSIIIDNLITLDAVICCDDSRRTRRTSTNVIDMFVMDDIDVEQDQQLSSIRMTERETKLDVCMVDVINFLQIVHHRLPNTATTNECNSYWLPASSVQTEVFTMLKTAFDEHLLMAHHITVVPYIWFYLCSLDTKYTDTFLDWLWQIVVSPNRAGIHKSHGAACYMSAFLARAKYIDIKQARDWLLVMIQWASDYVNQCADCTVNGALSHSNFYAVCQAIFLVFCFRYKNFVNRYGIAEINSWNIGHIVHSSLSPLKYMSWQVALCFSTITRSLQMIYCSQAIDRLCVGDIRSPFETFFPFDYYRLERSKLYIQPLTRNFSPIAESVDMLSNELKWISDYRDQTKKQQHQTVDDDDFLLEYATPDVIMS